MPATSEQTFNGITLTFTEHDHRYVDQFGREYTSATTMLKSFFPQFNAIAQSERMLREGKIQDAAAMRQQWTEKGRLACELGTRCHETAEAILAHSQPPHTPQSESERKKMHAIWEYCHQTILPNHQVLGSEIMVWCPRTLIAGTIDLLLLDPNGRLLLCDWKTNEKITYEGFDGEMGLGPCATLPASSFAKYALQLSLYQWILIHASWIAPGTRIERQLLHVREDGVIPLDVPYHGDIIGHCIAEHLMQPTNPSACFERFPPGDSRFELAVPELKPGAKSHQAGRCEIYEYEDELRVVWNGDYAHAWKGVA